MLYYRNATCDHKDANIGLWPLLRFLDGAISFARPVEDRRTDIVNVAIEPWHTDIRNLLEFNNLHRHELADQKSLTFTLMVPDLLCVSRVRGYRLLTLMLV